MEEVKNQNPNQEVVNAATEFNKKPRLLARILSGLVDIFIIFLVGFGAFQIVMRTGISDGYREVKTELITIIDNTKLETEYGHKLYQSEEDYSKYSEYQHYTEKDNESPHYGEKYVVVNNEDISVAVKKAYNDAMNGNTYYQSRYITYRAIHYGFLIMSAGVAELIFVFIIPLVNKRRATIGRYAAMTSLISRKEVEAKWWQLLIRFLFVLIVETGLPLLYFSELATLLIVGALNMIVALISRKTARTLRDYISGTRIIDKNTFKSINEQ